METYKFHPGHFPAMVADISLESLNSPTESNFKSHQEFCHQEIMHCGSSSGDINKNLSIVDVDNKCSSLLESSQQQNQTHLPDLDNDQAPSDKMLNSLNAKLSPVSRLQNLNDWEFQPGAYDMSADSKSSTNSMACKDIYCFEEGHSAVTHESNIGHCAIYPRAGADDAQSNRLLDNSNPTETCKLEVQTAINNTSSHVSNSSKAEEDTQANKSSHEGNLSRPYGDDSCFLTTHYGEGSVSQRPFDNEQRRFLRDHAELKSNAENNVSLSMTKPDIVSSHEIKDKIKTEENTGAQFTEGGNCLPTVDIKSLGDSNDGSYEINIHNIFPKNILPLSKTTDQLKTKSGFQIHNPSTRFSKSYHCLPYIQNEHSFQLFTDNKGYTKSRYPELDATTDHSLDILLPRNETGLLPSDNRDLENLSSENKCTVFRSKTKCFSQRPDVAKYAPLNLPYHTISSPKRRSFSSNDCDVNWDPVNTQQTMKDFHVESSIFKNIRRRRMLPKIPPKRPKSLGEFIFNFQDNMTNIEEETTYKEQNIPKDNEQSSSDRSSETLIKSPDITSGYHNTTDSSDQNPVCKAEGRSAIRPKSWCGSMNSQRDSFSDPRDSDHMHRVSRSEYDFSAIVPEIHNTASLASELCDAIQLESHDTINQSPNTEQIGLPSCISSGSLNQDTAQHSVNWGDLGSPEIVEPPSLNDSGYQQEPIVTPDQVKILNEVNKLKSNESNLDERIRERQIWLQSLLAASFCNRCRSTNPFNIMRRTLAETNFYAKKISKKSPTDLYIDDVPKSKEPIIRNLTLEFQGECARKGKYDVDKNALQINFQRTPMEETFEPFPETQLQEDKPLHGDDVDIDIDDVEVTHRCCHKFVPRHKGELFIEIGDPLYVEAEEDDLWCKGLNLRTKKKGIFPSVCAIDLDFHADCDTARPVKHYVKFLGSVEIGVNHKTNEILGRAIDKVAMARKGKASQRPALCCLEVSNQGIKMSDKVKLAGLWRKNQQSSSIQSPDENTSTSPSTGATGGDHVSKLKIQEHFFSLKNVSFCGCHPEHDKYFAFITKHPLERRFACHVFMGEESTKRVVDAIGAAFKSFFRQYLAASHPTEDIYIE